MNSFSIQDTQDFFKPVHFIAMPNWAVSKTAKTVTVHPCINICIDLWFWKWNSWLIES